MVGVTEFIISNYWRELCTNCRRMDRETSSPFPKDESLHTFIVQRGMAVAVVIETPDWYSGLLQSAFIRVRIEGQN
jgi:hypothetical protein